LNAAGVGGEVWPGRHGRTPSATRRKAKPGGRSALGHTTGLGQSAWPRRDRGTVETIWRSVNWKATVRRLALMISIERAGAGGIRIAGVDGTLATSRAAKASLIPGIVPIFHERRALVRLEPEGGNLRSLRPNGRKLWRTTIRPG